MMKNKQFMELLWGEGIAMFFILIGLILFLVYYSELRNDKSTNESLPEIALSASTLVFIGFLLYIMKKFGISLKKT